MTQFGQVLGFLNNNSQEMEKSIRTASQDKYMRFGRD